MVDHLIAFATAHYLLVGAFVILLALLIAHELSRGGRSLSTSELTALVNKDEAVVVDIRPAKDYAAGHIVGALNIPPGQADGAPGRTGKAQGQDHHPGRCPGPAPGTHAREMLKTGFTAAKLSGGISSWRGDNLPLVK